MVLVSDLLLLASFDLLIDHFSSGGVTKVVTMTIMTTAEIFHGL